MYAVTGASGQLGRLVIEQLIAKAGLDGVVALVRDPARVSDLADRGVQVRAFDYDAPDGLRPALEGIDRLLLISSSDVGRRTRQHRAVIDAARMAGVGFIAYTSILHADHSPLGLAIEHRETEAAIRASDLPHALLRNGWYIENYTMSAGVEIAHGGVIGSTGAGRISAATRADYAEAAAAVLLDRATTNRICELAGDTGFTLADYAATLAAASGKPVSYVDMPEEAYRAALEGMGLPGPLAAMLADSSAKASGGALFDDGHALRDLIGRPTTPLIDVVRSSIG